MGWGSTKISAVKVTEDSGGSFRIRGFGIRVGSFEEEEYGSWTVICVDEGYVDSLYFDRYVEW